MRALLKSLLHDETGIILSAEIVMVATVGVLALVAGWNAVSASLAEELGDVANAFGTLNQSYNIKSVTAVGHARCSGHGYNDSDSLVSVTGGGAAVAQGGGGFAGGAAATVGGRAEAVAAAEALVALDVVEVGQALVEESVIATGSAEANASALAGVGTSESVTGSTDAASRTRLLASLEAELKQLEAEARRLESIAKSQSNGSANTSIAPQAEDACELIRAENARLRRLIGELCRQVNGN